jgi:CHRD domain
VTSASTDFNVTYQFPADVKVTGLHVHKGKAGENGPATIDSGIKSTDPVSSTNGRGTINLQGQTAPGNAAGLDTVNGMLTDPSGFYVNLHTTEMRMEQRRRVSRYLM